MDVQNMADPEWTPSKLPVPSIAYNYLMETLHHICTVVYK
jgi:hypothetical protein